MIPTALFDKSFLQSINTEESAWFDHYFIFMICPLFYIETLADLKKENSRRPPEVEVMLIAEKLQKLNGVPSFHHERLCFDNLLGLYIPMDGRILKPKETVVKSNENTALWPEAGVFHRWAKRDFLERDHDIANAWRAQLANLDLNALPKILKSLGVKRKSCKTLQDVKNLTDSIVNKCDQPFEQMKFALDTLKTPQKLYRKIFENWKLSGYKPLHIYAPYATYLLTIEVFFAIAIAADFISADRPSNWTDIFYLSYLPFCSIFISSDKLHKRCAPYFLRSNQHFVWGIDFKKDLAKINEYFKKYSRAREQEKFVPKNLELQFQFIWDNYTLYNKDNES